MQTADMRATEEDTLAKNISPPLPALKGSPYKILAVDIAIAAGALGSIVAFNSPLTNMNKLSPSLKGFLAATPLITTALSQIPMTRAIRRNGGKKELLGVLITSSLGMAGLVTLSSLTDITAIDGTGGTYAAMALMGLAIGAGAGTFPLMINVINWSRKNKQSRALRQALFSSCVDFSVVLSPVTINLLKPLYGYPLPFALYTALVAATIPLVKWHHAPPYYQYKEAGVDFAREAAIEYGQNPLSLNTDENKTKIAFIKENLRVLCTPQSIILNFSFFGSLGTFYLTGIILPTILKNRFAITNDEAIYLSAGINMVSLVSRIITGEILSKCDKKTGGVKIHLLACGIAISGALPLALLSDIPRFGLYTSAAILQAGIGGTIPPPLCIADVWSTPINPKLKNQSYDISIMFGLLSTLGSIGGAVLSLADEESIFYLITGIMLLSAIGIGVTDYFVRDESLFHPHFSFFSSKKMELPSLSAVETAELDAAESIKTPMRIAH